MDEKNKQASKDKQLNEEKKEEKQITEVAKAEKEIAKEVTKIEEKVDQNKITQNKADKEIAKEVRDEIKKTSEETKIEKTKKKEKNNFPKKTEAVVNGKSLAISTKHAVAVCNFIKGKDIDKAILMLEEVIKLKKPVPMRGEIPHKKGIMSGRYPVNTAKVFVRLLKSLKANAIVNELELEKYKIFCNANIASRPYKRFGQKRAKRTHVLCKLVPIKKIKLEKKKSKK